MIRLCPRVLVIISLACLAGCKRKNNLAPGDEMALVPREASIVMALNLDRLHSSKLWQNAVDLRNDPANKKKYDDFVRSSGLDPLSQIRFVLVGMPSDVDTSKELVIVVRGAFDETKLIRYLKQETLKETGSELKVEPYGGKTVYGDPKGEMHLAVLDSSLIVIAGKGWIRRTIDLSQGKGTSVKNNEAVQALLAHVKTQQAIWGGGIVPPGRLQLPSGADIKSIVASVDFTGGLHGDVLAETPSPEEAKKLTEMTTAQVAGLKQTPMLAMFGLGPAVDALRATSDANAVHISLALSDQQTDELVNRLKGFAQMMAGAGGAIRKPAPQVEEIPEEDHAKKEPAPKEKDAKLTRGADAKTAKPKKKPGGEGKDKGL